MFDWLAPEGMGQAVPFVGLVEGAGTADTATVQGLPLTAPILAWTFAWPTPIAVALPVLLTLNTAGFEEDQTTCALGMVAGVGPLE